MASQFSVSTRELTNKAGDLLEDNNTLHGLIGTLREQEINLCKMWEGDAKDAFDNVFRSDIDQMIRFYEAVKQYVTNLLEIVDSYEEAENRNFQKATDRNY